MAYKIYYREPSAALWIELQSDHPISYSQNPVDRYDLFFGSNWITNTNPCVTAGVETFVFQKTTPFSATSSFFGSSAGSCSGQIYSLIVSGYGQHLFIGQPVSRQARVIGCETIFTSNGAVLKTVLTPICVEVGDLDGCSECCKELLPMLRGISI